MYSCHTTGGEDEVVLDYMSTEGIKWNFTTALAPWQGGFYKRLVVIINVTSITKTKFLVI